MKSGDRTFNPFKEAAGDYQLQRAATRQHWKTFCSKCTTEKPLKGGTFPGLKGTAMVSGGVIRRFVCAECLEKKA